MDNTIMQGALWIGAGLLLVLFMARRRKRRTAR
jgi:LPXTG-motif cell wall-anchored protein